MKDRGYHPYVEIWTTEVGLDSLCLKCEDGNVHNKYVMAVTIGGRTGGHAPKNLSKIFKLLLTLPNCAIRCKVTGNVLIEELDMD